MATKMEACDSTMIKLSLLQEAKQKKYITDTTFDTANVVDGTGQFRNTMGYPPAANEECVCVGGM